MESSRLLTTPGIVDLEQGMIIVDGSIDLAPEAASETARRLDDAVRWAQASEDEGDA